MRLPLLIKLLLGNPLSFDTINKFNLLLLYMSYKGIYRISNPKKYKGDSQNIVTDLFGNESS